MSTSDSPLTDAVYEQWVKSGNGIKMIAHAQRMERDRAMLREALQAVLPQFEKTAGIWQARASQTQIDAFNKARAALAATEEQP